MRSDDGTSGSSSEAEEAAEEEEEDTDGLCSGATKGKRKTAPKRYIHHCFFAAVYFESGEKVRCILLVFTTSAHTYLMYIQQTCAQEETEKDIDVCGVTAGSAAGDAGKQDDQEHKTGKFDECARRAIKPLLPVS